MNGFNFIEALVWCPLWAHYPLRCAYVMDYIGVDQSIEHHDAMGLILMGGEL